MAQFLLFIFLKLFFPQNYHGKKIPFVLLLHRGLGQRDGGNC